MRFVLWRGLGYTFHIPSGMVLENTVGQEVAAPTVKRGFVMSRFLVRVRLAAAWVP
jgi:hypothetical protein